MRNLDRETGEYETPDKPIHLERRATALMATAVYTPNSVHGVPHWIGASVAVAGSREAEEINFNSISNNMVPSMFLIVENGTLTASSAQRLTDYISRLVLHLSKNRSRSLSLKVRVWARGSYGSLSSISRLNLLWLLNRTTSCNQSYDKTTWAHPMYVSTWYTFMGKGDSVNRANRSDPWSKRRMSKRLPLSAPYEDEKSTVSSCEVDWKHASMCLSQTALTSHDAILGWHLASGREAVRLRLDVQIKRPRRLWWSDPAFTRCGRSSVQFHLQRHRSTTHRVKRVQPTTQTRQRHPEMSNQNKHTKKETGDIE